MAVHVFSGRGLVVIGFKFPASGSLPLFWYYSGMRFIYKLLYGILLGVVGLSKLKTCVHV